MKYLYNSEFVDEDQLELIKELRGEGVECIDTANWSEEKRNEVYNMELVPKSISEGKKLRGRVKSHKAGSVRFTDGVLIGRSNFYIGEEVKENKNLILLASG